MNINVLLTFNLYGSWNFSYPLNFNPCIIVFFFGFIKRITHIVHSQTITTICSYMPQNFSYANRQFKYRSCIRVLTVLSNPTISGSSWSRKLEVSSSNLTCNMSTLVISCSCFCKPAPKFKLTFKNYRGSWAQLSKLKSGFFPIKNYYSQINSAIP